MAGKKLQIPAASKSWQHLRALGSKGGNGCITIIELKQLKAQFGWRLLVASMNMNSQIQPMQGLLSQPAASSSAPLWLLRGFQ